VAAIVSRAQWGAAFTIPGGRHVAPSERRWFVVHWPGSAVGADERALVRAIERQHRQNQGWQAAPGYNFLVGRSGTIYEGCGRDVRGIHSPPRNIDGWGVCVLISVGESPPQAALNGTRALYNWLSGVAGRTLGMSWHGQHWATACAGPNLNAWVQAGMPAGTPAPPPRKEEIVQAAQYSDGRQIVAVRGASGDVFVLEQSHFGSTWTMTGRPAGGPVPLPKPVSVVLQVVQDSANLYIQAADPPAVDNGDVFTSWKLADGTWARWAQIS
jgi:hypothetical protein